MIIAMPLFGSEVSPRFDCAGQFLIARVEGGRIVDLKQIGMEESNPVHRARRLVDRKVNKLICGGIDGFCTRILNGLGIQVIPWVAGDAQQALEKYIAGLSISSKEKAFSMEDPRFSPTAAVMVVGAGIAGIQSALDLANSGFLVHLVERSSGIGGIMPQLDKTFPTNECSLWILSPKLVEVGRHKNIQLLTLTEVEGISGREGNLEVRTKQFPRYVDPEKCIACGLCAEKCPRKVKNEFDGGLKERKAIYLKYPQTVPLKYAIDDRHCLYLQQGKCRVCEKICPTKAIRFDDLPRERVLRVGSLILAPGSETFNPAGLDLYGYGRYPNVITGLELERLLSASGPTGGHLVRPSDGKAPRKMAFMQCVGSRDVNRVDRSYCSAVCCMAAIKEALIAQEHSSDPLEITVFYMDMRTAGKDFEKYFQRAAEKGIRFVRCRVHSLYPRPGAQDLTIRYADESGKIQEEEFGLVVLSTGLQVSEEALSLARRLGVELDRHHFALTGSFNPVRTNLPGVYACGSFAGPKDIPQAVMEASAAAAAAAAHLSAARGSLVSEEAFPEEKDITGEDSRIGVFVCHCGTNIGAVVRVPEVVEYARTLPNVAYAQENLFSCSQDAQDRLKEIIQKKKLNRVIIAACSPRTHEPLFQETLKRSGLNKYLLEMANIRDQCSWVHKDQPKEATAKAKDLVRMAVAKVNGTSPLQETTLPVIPSALIIGGGMAGMTAALNLARQGFSCHIVEKEGQLGGQARHLKETWKGENIQAHLKKIVQQVRSEENIHVHLETQVIGVEGFVGNFKSTLSTAEVIPHGVTLLASGALPSSTDQYLYGKHPQVTRWHELDELLEKNPERAGRWKCAVFILCTGSRVPERPYCSRVCCTSTLHRALRLKKMNPALEIYVLYREIRTYGQREDLFQEAREKGIQFIRYDLENLPSVEERGGKLQVTVKDPILDLPVRMEPDIINLATALVPSDNEALARGYRVPRNSEGFFLEAHMKLRPVDFATDGVFLCGSAHYPKPIDESIAQSLAAASRAATVLSQKSIRTSGIVARIDPETCIGCQSCRGVCPYEAISLDSSSRVCLINSALCKGCGACAAACSSGSAQLMGFAGRQLYPMIDQAVGF